MIPTYGKTEGSETKVLSNSPPNGAIGTPSSTSSFGNRVFEDAMSVCSSVPHRASAVKARSHTSLDSERSNFQTSRANPSMPSSSDLSEGTDASDSKLTPGRAACAPASCSSFDRSRSTIPLPPQVPPAAPFTPITTLSQEACTAPPAKSCIAGESWSSANHDVPVYAVVATPVDPSDMDKIGGVRNGKDRTNSEFMHPLRDWKVLACFVVTLGVIVGLSVVVGMTVESRRQSNSVNSLEGSGNVETSDSELEQQAIGGSIGIAEEPSVAPNSDDESSGSSDALSIAPAKSTPVPTMSPSPKPTTEKPHVSETAKPTEAISGPTPSPSVQLTEVPSLLPPISNPSGAPTDSRSNSVPTLSPSSKPPVPDPTLKPTEEDEENGFDPSSGMISTTYGGTIRYRAGGMFDVVALGSDLQIYGMDIHVATNKTVGLEVHMKMGTHKGHEVNGTLWTKISTDGLSVQGKGQGTPTPLPADSFAPVTITSGQKYAFYVTMTNRNDKMVTNKPADYNDPSHSNSDLKLISGSAIKYRFQGYHRPRIFNGALYYNRLETD